MSCCSRREGRKGSSVKFPYQIFHTRPLDRFSPFGALVMLYIDSCQSHRVRSLLVVPPLGERTKSSLNLKATAGQSALHRNVLPGSDS